MRYCLFLLIFLQCISNSFYLKETFPRGLEKQHVFHRRIGGVCVISELNIHSVNV